MNRGVSLFRTVDHGMEWNGNQLLSAKLHENLFLCSV